jgi:hypothetical protein
MTTYLEDDPEEEQYASEDEHKETVKLQKGKKTSQKKTKSASFLLS